MGTDSKPSLAAVLGHFSTLAGVNNWSNLDRFFNPRNTFEEVHIIALGDDYEYKERQFGTVFVHPIRSLIRTPRLKHINNIYVMAVGMLRLRQLVRTHRIELIAQIDATPLKYGLPAVFVAQRVGLPSIISLHSDYRLSMDLGSSKLFSWVQRQFWSYLFRKCTRIRAVSDYVAEFAYSHGVPHESVAVIPNMQVLDLFRVRPRDDELAREAVSLGIADLIRGSVVILTVGRLLKVKNLDKTLRAFARALERYPDMVYLIVGEGPLRGPLEALTSQLGIADKVRFLGSFPSHDRLRLIYHLSDVFLFPTLYEGQPRVIVEALLSKLAIICANYGQVCEVVVDGEDGYWVDPLDVDAITNAIVRLAADDGLRAEMSQHTKFDADRFSVERVTRQEADFYLSTISNTS